MAAAFVDNRPAPKSPPSVKVAPVAPPINAPPNASPIITSILFPSNAEIAPAPKPPKIAPKTIPQTNVLIAKCPVGSYLFTGSLPQYAYKFRPLILSGSKYSIESGEIHLHNSGE